MTNPIVGTQGNDTLILSSDDDYIYGSLGNDVYIYNPGGGHDQLAPSPADLAPNKMNAIRFGAGILPSNVAFDWQFNSYHLTINIVPGASNPNLPVGSIQVYEFVPRGWNVNSGELQRIEFSDGTVWNLQEIYRRAAAYVMNGTTGLNGNGHDSLTATGVANGYLDGKGGNDYLYGRSSAVFGGAGNDTLDSGYNGSAVMFGGSGNDSYYVYHEYSSVVEYLNEGIDTIYDGRGMFPPTLDLPQNVENLTLLGYVRYGFGNALNNVMRGNAQNNGLTGQAGNDTLYGFEGDDILVGGSGNDSMIGGVGNDVYYVDSSGDVVVELPGQGQDEVRSTISYILAPNSQVEDVTLLGSANLSAVGNGVANRITGNDGNNMLNGQGGADTMTGGQGDDTYVVSDAGDVVVEQQGGGTDTIQTSLSYTMPNHVENMTLNGSGSYSMTGNAQGNVLTGNSGANYLSGGDGNDTLVATVGVDTLNGGNGEDCFKFALPVAGIDHVVDFQSGIDRIEIRTSLLPAGPVQNWSASSSPMASAPVATILYDTSTGTLILDGNGSLPLGRTTIAIFDGHPPVAASDVFIVS